MPHSKIGGPEHRKPCSISVGHTGGIKTVMSNVDEKTTMFLPMVDAIKNLEGQLDWQKIQ